MKRCQSCGRLIELLEDFAGLDQSSIYCPSCADDRGKLRSFEEVLENLTQRIAKTDGFDESASRNAALQILGRQPAWEPKFKREEKVKKNQLRLRIIAITVVVSLVTAGVTIWLTNTNNTPDNSVYLGYSVSKGENPFEKTTTWQTANYKVTRFAAKGDQIPTAIDKGVIKVKSLEDFGSIWKMTKKLEKFEYYAQFDLLGDRSAIVKNMPYLSTYWNSYLFNVNSKKKEGFQPERNEGDSLLKSMDHPIVYIDDNPEQKRMIITKKESGENLELKRIMPMDKYRKQKDEGTVNDDFFQITDFSFDKSTLNQLLKNGRFLDEMETFSLDYKKYFTLRIPFRQPKYYNPKTGKTKTIPMNLDKDFDYIYNDRYFTWTRLRYVNNDEIPFSYDISNLIIDKQNIEDNRQVVKDHIDWRFNHEPVDQPFQELMCFDMQTGKTYTIVSLRQMPNMGLDVNYSPMVITNNRVYFWNYFVNRLFSYEMSTGKMTRFDKPWFNAPLKSRNSQVFGKIQNFMTNEQGKKINQLEDVALIAFNDKTSVTSKIADGKVHDFWVSQSDESTRHFTVYSRLTPKVQEPYSYFSKDMDKLDTPEKLVFKAEKDSKNILGLYGPKLVWCKIEDITVNHPMLDFSKAMTWFYRLSNLLPTEYGLEVKNSDKPQLGQLFITDLETGETIKLDDGCCWGAISDGKTLTWARYKQSDSEDIDVCYTTLE
ncbi:MAG: hypothetical protein KA140_04180 [Caldisericia bacterium]|nr:hypothetical protein [Caldisericia bacterium]